MQIKGKITHQTLGPGFWGIIGNDHQKWRPVNMPEELKTEGLEVEIEAEETSEQMSIFMWGKAIKINQYKILSQ